MLLMRNSDLVSELRGAPFDERELYSWVVIDDALKDLSRAPKIRVAYFYRHAATEFNEMNLISGQKDVDLSSQGLNEAADLRKNIPEDFDIVLCSRLKRTWQTMYVALDGRRTKPGFYVDQRLNEVSLGEFEGQKRHHIEAFARGDIDFRPPGGESYRTAAQRAFSFYIDLLTSETKTSLVFTHAGIMRIFSSLHFPMHNSVEMFSRDFHNTFCIRVKSNEIKLPRFWLS